jgi:hypothetical protein
MQLTMYRCELPTAYGHAYDVFAGSPSQAACVAAVFAEAADGVLRVTVSHDGDRISYDVDTDAEPAVATRVETWGDL